MRFDVYLPHPDFPSTIDAGSGIVSSEPGTAERLVVDFEGNRYGSSNLVTYADRLHHAAGRHATRYPTVARHLLRPQTLVRIGAFDDETGDVDLYDTDLDVAEVRALLCAWLTLDDADLDAQLRTEGSSRHQMLREVRTALASGQPAMIDEARRMAKRYQLPV